MRATVEIIQAWRDEPYRVECATLTDARRTAKGIERQDADDTLIGVRILRADGDVETAFEMRPDYAQRRRERVRAERERRGVA